MRSCPRCKTGRLLTGDKSQFNPVSKYTGKQICPTCRVDEAMGYWTPKDENASV